MTIRGGIVIITVEKDKEKWIPKDQTERLYLHVIQNKKRNSSANIISSYFTGYTS